MSENGLTVTYKLERPIASRGLKKAANAGAEAGSRGKPPQRSKADPDRLARMLALAYYVEREIENGRIKDYSEAARLLGMSRTRMTQVANLLALSPIIQETILTGQLTVAEHALREMTGQMCWNEQATLH